MLEYYYKILKEKNMTYKSQFLSLIVYKGTFFIKAYIIIKLRKKERKSNQNNLVRNCYNFKT